MSDLDFASRIMLDFVYLFTSFANDFRNNSNSLKLYTHNTQKRSGGFKRGECMYSLRPIMESGTANSSVTVEDLTLQTHNAHHSK